MIYVRVELWPGGDRLRGQLLAQGGIANDGTGNAKRGNYQAAFQVMNTEGEVAEVLVGDLHGFDRGLGVMELIQQMLPNLREQVDVIDVVVEDGDDE